MKINSIGMLNSVSFKSLRTDKNLVRDLKNGELSISDNKKENILAALNSFTVEPERKSIEFLLDVAKNLAYGQQGNSEFKDSIDKVTNIESERENTDWSAVLADTIQKALNSSKDDVADLKEEYSKLISTKQPLTPLQKEVLNLRFTLQTNVLNQDSLSDADSLIRGGDIYDKIDYFVSSSEISLTQKKACLEKLIHFISDDYKINPQLKDKKLQVLDEILDDIIVKTPEEQVLTTKKSNQLYTGMCAAISICRKAMAYEDKVRFIEIIMDELQDSPEMEIYDVTKLDTKGEIPKVKVPKIKINYDMAQSMGYRIIDASAHQWMKNAYQAGDGTIELGDYSVFDEDTYGIFHDSFWYTSNDEFHTQEKALLKNLIMEKDLLDSTIKLRDKTQEAATQIQKVKKESVETLSAINGKLEGIFSEIFTKNAQDSYTNLKNDIVDFYKGSAEDNEINVGKKLPREVKEKLLEEFISAKIPMTEDEKAALSKNIKRINSLVEAYLDTEEDVQTLKKYSSLKSKYSYNKKLYKLAAAHRFSLLADIDLPDGVVRFEKISGLPPRDVQIATYLKSLQKSLSNPQVLNRFSNGKSEDEVRTELMADIAQIESILPERIDSVLKQMLNMTVEDITRTFYVDLKHKIESSDELTMEKAAALFEVKNDKTKLLKTVNKWIERLENSPTDEQIQEAIRLLGYEDRCQLVKVFVDAYFASLQNGISESQFAILARRAGGKEKVGEFLTGLREECLDTIIDKQYGKILEKWQVPTARQLIVKQLEENNEIITKQKLSTLKSRFDYITKGITANDKIENVKARAKANDELFVFKENEKEILDDIEKQIPRMKKYAQMEYKAINSILKDDLDAQYADIGMLDGQFWVREEGSTGLYANSQVKIMEQMTGKPYHIEYDMDKASKQIKKGEGTGILSCSVADNRYAFHAMYAPAITSETFISPLNGEKETKDVLWTDNTWGKSEKEYFWNGKDGFNYTDYGCGYGWKKGFILSPDMKIGLSVDDIKTGVGVNAKDGEKFGLFGDMVLPGMPDNGYQKLYKMFRYIMEMNNGETYVSSLENLIKSGTKINPDELSHLDEVAEVKVDNLLNRIKKEIKTKEDFEKLPDDDYLKFALSLLSLYLSTTNPLLTEAALDAESMQDINELKQDFLQEHVDEIGAILAKSDNCVENLFELCEPKILDVCNELNSKFNLKMEEKEQIGLIYSIFFDEEAIKDSDGTLAGLEKYLIDQIVDKAVETYQDDEQASFFIENTKKIVLDVIDEYLRIKSLDSPVLENSPLSKELIAAVDKYLNPESDQQLLDFLIGLQAADYDTANEFIEMLTEEDVGLVFKDPFEYIQKLQVDDSEVYTAFYEAVATNVIYDALDRKEEFEDEDDSNLSPEQLIEKDRQQAENIYRTLCVKLGEMDVQKYIRKFESEFFRKYKVRQAFPQPLVLNDEDIVKSLEKTFAVFENLSFDIQSYDMLINLFDKYENMMNMYQETKWFKALENGESVDVSDIEEIKSFRLRLIDLYDYTKKDESLSMLSEQFGDLILALNLKNAQIDSKTASLAMNEIQAIFADWEKSSISKEPYVEEHDKKLKELKESIKLSVNSNIEPRYRDVAVQLLKNIIDKTRHNAPEEEIEFLKEQYACLAIEKHITKNPSVLLSEFMKLLQQGKTETDEYKTLRYYLVESLKIAQQTKVQYKLVQNAHNGIISKTTDLLPMFKVETKDGLKDTMDSDIGIFYLINQLKNKNENYATLSLFLHQLGLNQRAVSVIVDNYKMDESYKFVDKTKDEILQKLEEMNNLTSLVKEFFAKNQIKFNSYNQAVQILTDFVKRRAGNYEDGSIAKMYVESMLASKGTNVTVSSVVDVLLKSLTEDAISYLSQKINDKIESIPSYADFFEEEIDLLESIDVPENSEAARKRADFIKQYDELSEYMNKTMQEISSVITSSQYLNAEYVNG